MDRMSFIDRGWAARPLNTEIHYLLGREYSVISYYTQYFDICEILKSQSFKFDYKYVKSDCVDHSNRVFVYGANKAGRHGAGAAKYAVDHFAAQYGSLYSKNSYGICTKDENIQTLSLEDVAVEVLDFLSHAKKTPNHTYDLTRIGCGLAGYSEEDIVPLFTERPSNVNFPFGW